MKTSIVVASASAAPEAFAVLRGFDEAIDIAQNLGYDGIELALKDPDEICVPTLTRSLEKSGMKLSAISTGQVFSARGLMLTDNDIERSKELLHVFRRLIDLASAFGCPVNIGRVRGVLAPEKREEGVSRSIALLRRILEYAEPRGVDILLEPVNRMEINFINNIDEALSYISAVGMPNLALMADTYHISVEEQDPTCISRAGDLLRYVHIADSNRCAPGSGTFDFRSFFEVLGKMGYDGWCTVECMPEPDSVTAARDSIVYLRDGLIPRCSGRR